MIAKDYAFINSTTYEPLWDIFNPPKDLIRPSDEIINPETGEPYWTESNEVFLVPIEFIVNILPLPFNVETNTYYW